MGFYCEIQDSHWTFDAASYDQMDKYLIDQHSNSPFMSMVIFH